MREMPMPTHATPSGPAVPPPCTAIDGMDVLDLCHRHMVFKLGTLSALYRQARRNMKVAERRDAGREMAARRRAEREHA
jgi:hypothetical protein